jgi:hypothetical protein
VNSVQITRDRKYFFDREEKSVCAQSSREKKAERCEKLRSRMLAFRADARDRAIGVKFPARDARSFVREISFTIRALRLIFFSALVLITK